MENYGSLLEENQKLRQEAQDKGLYTPWTPKPIGADAFTSRDESWQQLGRVMARQKKKQKSEKLSRKKGKRGGLQKRPNGMWRARGTDGEGHRVPIGDFRLKSEGNAAIRRFYGEEPNQGQIHGQRGWVKESVFSAIKASGLFGSTERELVKQLGVIRESVCSASSKLRSLSLTQYAMREDGSYILRNGQRISILAALPAELGGSVLQVTVEQPEA